MSDRPHKHPKWEKFKEAMKKAGKWSVRNLLPVVVSVTSEGLGLSVTLPGLASELLKKMSDAKLKIPMSEDTFQKKLEELCKGEGKVIEYLQEKLEEGNEQMGSEDVNLIVEQVMTPVVSEMNTMLEIMREEKADLKEILAGWLEEQSSKVRNEFSLTHEQLMSIQNEMLKGLQKMDLQQSQILENINNIQSKMQFELVNIKQELSKQIQSVFGQSVQTAYDLNTMFNLATKHFNHQNLASRFDQPYNPDLYVRPELFFVSITQFLNDFKDPMKKDVPIFLLLAHLGMGKTWNFAYITEYLLREKNLAIPFFINLKDGLQQQLYGIFKTKNRREIADRCLKIKNECQLPIILILDGLDELTIEELRDVLLILRQLLGKRTDALCVALSCRIIAWVQEQQILNEREFFEYHIWTNHHCSDWKNQFEIATPISCVLGEFSDIELDAAIDRYGLEKQNISPGLYEICHQPYILRLVSEFIGLHNEYPEPENPKSMESLFYSDNLDAQKNTILYRMGIHGNILRLFSRIIKAFPSADSELSDEEFQKFVNDQYFRPILYSGIILRKWRKMVSVYSINSVYVPLLSLTFSHLSKTITSTPQTAIFKSESGKKVQYFLKMANKRRNEKNFDAELKSLKEAESVAVKAEDSNLINHVKQHLTEFEKAQWIRDEPLRKAKEDAERKAKEEAEREARGEAERKARGEAEREAGEGAEQKAKGGVELNKIVNYKGTNIIKREIDVLAELEKYGQIPIVSSIDWNTLGVQIEDNHVVGLGLYNKGWYSCPHSIEQLKNLTYLNLANNFFIGLSDSIGQLKNLTYLNLANNLLTGLPDSIGHLTKLNELTLERNRFTKLPETIGQLTELNYLNIKSNQLTELPESIRQLKYLKCLNLKGSRLRMLPDSIGQLKSLTYLNLAYNWLKELPDSIGQLTSLKKLYVYNNDELTSLPDSIGLLTELEELVIKKNPLKSIPDSIGHLTKLTHLDLAYVGLRLIPESVGQLTKLTYLNLNGNRLRTLPESIGQLIELEKLFLYQNPLTELSETVKMGLKRLKALECEVFGYDVQIQ